MAPNPPTPPAAGRPGRTADRRTPAAVAVPALASAAVAMIATALLAHHNAPRADELHTLSHLGDRDLGAFWRSYRDARDTLPPAGYVLAWLWAKVAGPGLEAARIPVVASWGAAAAATAVLTRRAGPWASFAAGLVPSATALVFLGGFARPYATAYACLVGAVVCWHEAGRADRGRGWLVGALVLGAAATSLHYAVAAALLLVSAATFAPPRSPDTARRPGRAAGLALGAVVPLVASIGLLPRAAADQGRLPRTAGPFEALAFWPSTTRPMWPVAAALALPVLAVLAAPGRRRSPGRRIDPQLAWAAVALVVLVPAATVAGMALTSGTYVHRYGVGALLGAAVLSAGAVAAAASHRAALGPLLALGLVAGVAAATHDVSRQFVSVAEARALPTELALSGTGRSEVVVIDEYDFLLLRRYGGAGLAARLRLGSPPAVADSPRPVDLDARLDRDPTGTRLEVVGARADLDRILRSHPDWTVVELADARYVRPGVARTIVHLQLTRT